MYHVPRAKDLNQKDHGHTKRYHCKMSKSSTPKFWHCYGYLASKCLNVELFLKMIFGNKGGEEELGILEGLISQVTIFYFRSEYDAKKVCSACQCGYSHPLMSHNIQS